MILEEIDLRAKCARKKNFQKVNKSSAAELIKREKTQFFLLCAPRLKLFSPLFLRQNADDEQHVSLSKLCFAVL